jgi:hypothetical protein
MTTPHETPLTKANKKRTQRAKFVQAARAAGADQSEATFNRALRKVASAPPAPMPKKAKKRRKSA